MDPWNPPTVEQFQAQFFRDFPYSPDGDPSLDYVQPQDITNAIADANAQFTPIFGDNNTLFFMYLAAHCLVQNLRNASKGIAAAAEFALESSAVGSVSLANQIVEYFKQDPMFSSLLATAYGKKYLDFIYPYTIAGGAGIIFGTVTNA